MSLQCFLLSHFFHLAIELHEARRSWSLLSRRTTELEHDGQVFALVVEVADGEGVVLEIIVRVVNGMVRELGHSVGRVNLVVDQAAVFLVFNHH